MARRVMRQRTKGPNGAHMKQGFAIVENSLLRPADLRCRCRPSRPSADDRINRIAVAVEPEHCANGHHLADADPYYCAVSIGESDYRAVRCVPWESTTRF